MTYKEAYEQGSGTLAGAGIEEARLDARLLLEYVCRTNRNTLLAHGDRELSAEEETSYEGLISGRLKRIPLQYLTGEQSFMGLEFAVNEYVLIPRQDTEILVEEVLRELHDGMRVLDMCTGSGCILISLLHYSNDCSGLGADISEEALKVAAGNANRLLKHPDDVSGKDADGQKRIEFVQSNLFERVDGQFDIIVSNPPYIRTKVIETLAPEVRIYEPLQALDGSEDGLLFYRRIITEGTQHLKRGGTLFFEIGCDQGKAVSRLLEEAGYLEVRVVKDYAGLDRVVTGIRSFESQEKK